MDNSIISLEKIIPEPAKTLSDVAESGETYLETILLIKERNKGSIVRAVDIANELGFSKPSVSRALSVLKSKNLIIVADSGAIDFTPQGLEIAKEVIKRHQILTAFLQYTADVPPDIAEKDACRIEHIISNQTMFGIINFLKKNNIL